jgi:hypothetical protein
MPGTVWPNSCPSRKVVLKEVMTGSTPPRSTTTLTKPAMFSLLKRSRSTSAENRVEPGWIVRVTLGGFVSGAPRLRNSSVTSMAWLPGLWM